MAWFGAALEGITGLGQTWLENKAKVRDAEFGLKLAKLKAKTEAACVVQQKTFSLDEMAVREAAKTWWDEGLVVLYLMPYIYTIAYQFRGAEWIHPDQLWQTISDMPQWYLIGLVLIGVRYLGFRNLLRNAIAAWQAKKGFIPSKGGKDAEKQLP